MDKYDSRRLGRTIREVVDGWWDKEVNQSLSPSSSQRDHISRDELYDLLTVIAEEVSKVGT